MARIEFTAQFFGDDAARRASVDADITEMRPLAGSSTTGDPVALRVRAEALSPADVAALTGTGWTDATVADAGRTVAGKASKLELREDGTLEFLITPDR